MPPAYLVACGALGIVERLAWPLLVAGNLFVIFCLLLIVLPVGRVRLGGADAKPESSLPSWLALLFAADGLSWL